MKKSIELVNTSYGARLVHNLWVPGTENEKKGCRFSDGQQAAIDLSELCKHGFPKDIPDGTKVTLTMNIPRPKGWYPAIMKDNSKKVLYWNGEGFRSGIGELGVYTCTWSEGEYSWVADEPIPDPFGGLRQ